MARSFVGLLFIFCMLNGFSQNILNDQKTLDQVEACLEEIYGFDFEPAERRIAQLKRELPNHPAPYFLEGLWYYWKYFPLLPQDRELSPFLNAMQTSIEHSTQRLKQNASDMEGIFFDMHARAFRGMFWADNGRPGKVILDLDNMYRQTMKGITYKEKFVEFYFSSGLYNYYIEAYVELRPVYKPIAALFKKGDKVLGIKELQYAIEHTTYIRYEAMLFMSLLQLNYEKDLETAARYAEKLHQLFPRNIYYSGQLLIILLHGDRFLEAAELVKQLKKQPGDFEKMLVDMGEGFLHERLYNNPKVASTYYERCLLLAEPFGPITDLYKAVAYAGLARLSGEDGDEKLMRKYRRKSTSANTYPFILDYDNLREK